jgi:putative FmdB family regulatory protein
MPIYEYRCERGHTFEVMQRMTDDPLTVCPEHGTPVQRVFHPVAVHFKGSGFYNTDYGKKKSGAAGSSSEGSSSEGSSSEGSSKSDSSKSDSSGSGSGSGSGSKDSSSTKSSSGSD